MSIPQPGPGAGNKLFLRQARAAGQSPPRRGVMGGGGVVGVLGRRTAWSRALNRSELAVAIFEPLLALAKAYAREGRLPLLDRSLLPSVGLAWLLLWPPRCPALPPVVVFFGRPRAFFGASSSASLRALAGLLGSAIWLLVGGEAVSDPEESCMVSGEAGNLG